MWLQNTYRIKTRYSPYLERIVFDIQKRNYLFWWTTIDSTHSLNKARENLKKVKEGYSKIYYE